MEEARGAAAARASDVACGSREAWAAMRADGEKPGQCERIRDK